MKLIRVTIELEEPVLANALEGDPNSGVSHDYIPGSLLRGFLIGRFMRSKGLDTLDLQDETTRHLFFSDQVSFLNGYLQINGKRSVPAPRLLEKSKYGGELTAFNMGVLGNSDQHDACKKDKPKRDALGKFITLSAEGILRKEPLKSIRVHIQRDRVGGRPRGDDDGTVYRYEALAAEQTFEAWIVVESDADASAITNLLGGAQGVIGFLGGARSAGYGRARLRGEVADLPADGAELPVGALNGLAQIAFTSDVIVRDARGHYTPTLSALLRYLGISAEQVVKVGLRTTMVGGFNRKWGLPLPQTAAIVSGSWLLLKDVDLAALRQHLARGIGERRSEGFGRFVLNAFTESEYRYEDVRDAAPEEVKAVLHKDYQWVVNRLKQQQAERARLANVPVVSDPPSSNQINKVLGWVNEAKKTSNHKCVTENLKAMRSKARDQFEKARVEKKKLWDWLKEKAEAGEYETIELVLLRAAKQNQNNKEAQA